MITRTIDFFAQSYSAQLAPEDRILALVFGPDDCWNRWATRLLAHMPQDPALEDAEFATSAATVIVGYHPSRWELIKERVAVWCYSLHEAHAYHARLNARG